ncbi:MAG: TonB-dependent receptor plug domain-containing protein, partial [Bacteroidales bacterium]
MKKTLISLILISWVGLLYGQEITVNGTVTSETDGTPLPGVTITIKGDPTRGTSSDIDGKYSIKVDANQSLVFSFIGMESKEVPVNGQSEINVTLKESSQVLEELVVVGYGIQKKSLLTSSIAKVGSSEIQKSNPLRVEQALQGKTAGVQIIANSGQPGDGLTVRIRGVGTNGTSDPIYVVDGMPVGGIDYLNPNDIESIQVLKDASATAIYGARGANGVVLITTKGGEKGKMVVNYDYT